MRMPPIGYLVLGFRENEVSIPLEVLLGNVTGRKSQLYTVRTHACHIGILANFSIQTGSTQPSYQVIVLAFVPIHAEVDTVIQKT